MNNDLKRKGICINGKLGVYLEEGKNQELANPLHLPC